ncbi:MAG: hypothetical protein B0D96_08060 [Candidatus Sedimenticola endophacoides]|uniref:DUF4194 domain-containing protein n=1 Tax=Candidatus Sedimenticola endophacoides TaxID=2548426 RepID=A0A657PWV6_9GAMM|nr:MAG: hypothetical protein B0D94_11680 [Candidatus Sedimenticola endophacoides]OQX34944.1 MAG: hypothetical protein B0D96_08060 [Candidatus Sedimenticola endophacoides]OQX40522.1 MAG: hypothetical protein B0D89_07400 [Candidatus Sedimenticola endophacoides]OQX44915.1 MAG: hypothetical protein B0D85_06325 [Candidatus Sedimenticola endophacoides]OQX44929.1 MAG: hypothetical protein B0D88_01450 [Candidatus Sedimenticola endophacoides]
MNETAIHSEPNRLGPVLIQLFKGVLYRERHELLWQALLELQGAVRDYISVIGLELSLDESEGYAFLRQRDGADEEEALPRLVQRRALSYPVSLLCVLLRKRLVEQDASGGETRAIVTRQQIIEMMRLFLPEMGNEAKQMDQIGRHISKVVEYGFLSPLRGQDGEYEIRRILKALVDADWLADLDSRLEAYREYARGDGS